MHRTRYRPESILLPGPANQERLSRDCQKKYTSRGDPSDRQKLNFRPLQHLSTIHYLSITFKMPKKEHVEVVSDPETDSYDSESDVTEDEDGLDLTPALDAAILRTLGKIRRGEGVYNAEKVLEQELAEAEAEAMKRGVKVKQTKKEVAKPYLLADHHRAALLSGEVNDEDVEMEQEPPMTYAQEERKMRKDAIDAFKAFGEDGDEDDFVPVKRQKEEKEVDEADEGYRQFLLEMGGGEDEVRRLLGMGDQPVSHVRDVEEETPEAGSVKKESDKKKQKRLARKRQDDDSFLMESVLAPDVYDCALDRGSSAHAQLHPQPGLGGQRG